MQLLTLTVGNGEADYVLVAWITRATPTTPEANTGIGGAIDTFAALNSNVANWAEEAVSNELDFAAEAILEDGAVCRKRRQGGDHGGQRRLGCGERVLRLHLHQPHKRRPGQTREG